MKNVWRFGLSSVAGLLLIGGALALANANAHRDATTAQAAPQTQSISGKITSVEKNSFTLTVGSAMEQVAQEGATARSMTFAIDKNTTIEGTLKVGSNADVTYRTESGANIAISVHVTP
jgi:Cu/Ag efflux protein CusF